jgi:hypothetical protein
MVRCAVILISDEDAKDDAAEELASIRRGAAAGQNVHYTARGRKPTLRQNRRSDFFRSVTEAPFTRQKSN